MATPAPNFDRKELVIPRELSDAQKKAMQKGRQRRAKVTRKESVTRVLAFRDWMNKDAEYWRQQRAWLEYGTPMTVKKPKVPVSGIPSDYDYQVAREEGAIK